MKSFAAIVVLSIVVATVIVCAAGGPVDAASGKEFQKTRNRRGIFDDLVDAVNQLIRKTEETARNVISIVKDLSSEVLKTVRCLVASLGLTPELEKLVNHILNCAENGKDAGLDVADKTVQEGYKIVDQLVPSKKTK